MIKRLIKGVVRRLLRQARIQKFRILSTNRWRGATPQLHQPLLLAGVGNISFEPNVSIGYQASPKFWSSECYIEARSPSAQVAIGRDTWINNNFSAISNGSSISIGRDCLIGPNVLVVDSDFHGLGPEKRRLDASSRPVYIGDNVFIGAGVTILKNAKIGDGSVVAAGAVVAGQFPARSLIAGNPARLIRSV